MLNNVKIFPKILIGFAVVTAVSSLTIHYQNTVNQNIEKKALEAQFHQTSDLISSDVNRWVKENIRISQLITKLPAFRNMDASSQVSILEQTALNFEWMSLMFTADMEGNAIARSDGKPLKNYSDREYFKSVKAGNTIGEQVLIGKVKPVPLHCFAIPIYRAMAETTGVLTQCSTLTQITELIASKKIGNTGFAMLLDSKNRLIADGGHLDKLEGSLQHVGNHPALSINDNELTTLTIGGRDVVFLKIPVASGWHLILQQDYADAFQSYQRSKRNALYLITFSTILTILIAFTISHGISKPIVRLTHLANDYSRGKFDESAPYVDRKDEIGELTRSLERMTKSIQIAMSRLKKAS